MAAGYLCGLVGLGVGGPPRPGLVRVGLGVEDVLGALVATVAAAAVPSAVVAELVAGTTSTTGVEVALTRGVGAALTGVTEAGPDVPAPLGRGSAGGPPLTAQAMPAEPTSAARPSTRTMPWRRGALCRPIARVSHRVRPVGRGSMGG
jgi:hypothetical protein